MSRHWGDWWQFMPWYVRSKQSVCEPGWVQGACIKATSPAHVMVECTYCVAVGPCKVQQARVSPQRTAARGACSPAPLSTAQRIGLFVVWQGWGVTSAHSSSGRV